MSEVLLNITSWTPVQQMQAFCVNPPDDLCPSFGACPNPDVTGYGQQASVYITEVLFSFLLAFWPTKIHSTIYAHSVLILSLHITATMALFRGQLTQNDAIFILVLVASPTTIYLWVWTFFSVLTRRLFRSSDTAKFAAFLVFLTFAMEVLLVLTMYIPSKYIKFSQPACFPGYGREAITEIFWPVSFLIQIIFFWLVIGLYFGIYKIAGRPASKDDTSDVMTWMEDGICDMVNVARDHRSVLVPACLAMIQFQTWFIWAPIPGLLGGFHLLICIFGIMYTVIRRGVNIEFWIFLVLGVLSLAAFALPIITYFNLVPQIDVSSFAHFSPYASGVIITVVCTLSLWRHRRPNTQARMMTYCLLFVIPLILLKVLNALLPYFHYLEFGISQSYFKDLNFAEHLKNLLFGIFTFANLPWLFVAWLTTSQWSRSSQDRMGWRDVWHATAARAHLLKFGLLVVFPNALWIAATIATNPTISIGSFTIGQTFAIIVSLGNIISVFVDFHEIKAARWKEIIWAILKSKEIRWNVKSGGDQGGDLPSPSDTEVPQYPHSRDLSLATAVEPQPRDGYRYMPIGRPPTFQF